MGERISIDEYISNITHNEESLRRKIRKEAPGVEIKVDEVRSELKDLLSEPGKGESVDDLLGIGGDVPVVSAKEKRRLITLAIHNILAKKSARKRGRNRKIEYTKREEPIRRGEKGRAAHQQEKKDEIDQDDTDA